MKNNQKDSTKKNASRIVAISMAAIIVALIVAVIIVAIQNDRRNEKLNKKTEKQSKEAVTEVPTGDSGTLTPSITPSETEEPTVSPTPDNEPAKEISPTSEVTPTETVTPTESVTPTPGCTPTPDATPTPLPTPTPVVPSDPSKTPFGQHGKLKVQGTSLVDASGKVFQLKGVSTHGLQWFPEYVNIDTFRMLRDEWNANVVRLAMYTDENGYCTCSEAEKQKIKTTVKNGIQYATDLGLYVIVDWHILHDLTPMKYVEESKAFFNEICKEYAGYDNVIYEICNEPNGGTGWDEIREYAEIIIPIIRSYNKDSIIIVGTPTWSQDVDLAAKNPIKSSNIMYSLHFYAGTHKDNLRQKMVAAIKAGLPIFVSEFGITDASGNGRCDIDEANKWIVVLNENHVSYVCWNLANKNESSSMIQQGVKKLYGLKDDEISTEGLWLISVLHDKIPVSEEEKEKILKDSEQGFSGGDPGAPGGFSYSQTINGVKVSIMSVNTWMEGSKYCYQMDFVLKNGTANTLNGWNYTISANCGIACSDFWCSTIKVNGKSFTITPADYNRTVSKGNELTGIGFILKCDQELKTMSISASK